MPHRIEVGLHDQVVDPRGEAVRRSARDYLGLRARRVRVRAVYKLTFALDDAAVDVVRAALTDPVIEESAVGRLPLPACHWVVRVGYRPGVTDNVGRTARVFVQDLLPQLAGSAGEVFGETLYLIECPELRREQVEQLARGLLANELIERVQIWCREEYEAAPVDLEIPEAGSRAEPRCEAIALPDADEALLALSRARTLSLSLAELHAIRAHYRDPEVQARRARHGLPADPTDVELEALAQTWSEHCKHKIFNARIAYTDDAGRHETIDSLFHTFIAGPTHRIAERVGWLVSVFHDNAGVVRLDDETYLAYKVETHNSPSALDPVGGAMTGIVGVNRDPFGTGLGAALLTNVWGYCLAAPDHAGQLPAGLLHPRRIRDGVHRGVIEGGNQSGIPYSRGWELFDERYLGKPLVFCGTVGVMPATVQGRPSEVKTVEPGDHVVMVGGRIGKDGIHGATFSSEALHGESPAQAVQIGDPITQKMMTDMLLEARDRGLYRAITDNGAGGLSSSVGEMARLSGGAELHLERAPLKYEGLMPWEILLSEAQERMTLAVPPQQLDELLALARRREVLAVPIGRFDDSGTFAVYHEGRPVARLEMGFLHDGCPQLELEARWCPPDNPEPAELGLALEQQDLAALLLDVVGSLNLCSKERLARQYDHEVKGLSVIKPLVGVHGDVAADATVMRVRHGADAALLLAEGIAPRLSDIDGRAMGAYVVDLAVRRLIAGGARLGAIAGLDNFCWPDPVQSEQTPDGAQKLAILVRCCQGLAAFTEALGVPLISGKDSMKNDSLVGGVKISVPPTLLLSAIGWIPDAQQAIDLVVPEPGCGIYVLGVTGRHLGGSEAYAELGRRRGQLLVGRHAPLADAQRCRAVCAALQAAVEAGLVAAAHAPHLGGLGMGLATLCLASDLGLEIALDAVPRDDELSPIEVLFSESASRFLVAVRPAQQAAFEGTLAFSGIPWARVGTADEGRHLCVRERGDAIVDLPLDALRQRFHRQAATSERA